MKNIFHVFRALFCVFCDHAADIDVAAAGENETFAFQSTVLDARPYQTPASPSASCHLLRRFQSTATTTPAILIVATATAEHPR